MTYEGYLGHHVRRKTVLLTQTLTQTVFVGSIIVAS